MKNKKNGFTLVEILAVLVLVAALAAISIPSIIGYINNSKTNIDEVSKQLIFSGTELYVQNNKNDYTGDAGSKYCVTLNELVKDGLISEAIINSTNGEEIDLDMFVAINYNYDDNLGINKYTYELTNNCEQLIVEDEIPDDGGDETPDVEEPNNYICNAVTVATTGNVPKGNFEFGDEYICDPGDGISRRFFVYDINGYGDIIYLIMAENIGSFTTCSEINADDLGKAQAYLGRLKLDWTVDVTMPDARQIVNIATGKWTYPTGTISNLPSWLYVNLDNNTSTNIPRGYFVENAANDDYRFLWGVSSGGTMASWYEGANCSRGDLAGTRPVIEVGINQIG